MADPPNERAQRTIQEIKERFQRTGRADTLMGFLYSPEGDVMFVSREYYDRYDGNPARDWPNYTFIQEGVVTHSPW